MKLIQQNKDRDSKGQWAAIAKLETDDLQEYLNDEHNYPLLFNDLSNHIYKITQTFMNEENYSRIWRSSVISDIICHSVLQNLSNVKTDPFTLAQKLVREVNEMEVAPSPIDFAKRFKELPSAQSLNLKVAIEATYFSRFHYQTPSFKNVFLGGNAGNGKSMILSYIAMWAFKNNWIVINVPSGYKWTNDRKIKH